MRRDNGAQKTIEQLKIWAPGAPGMLPAVSYLFIRSTLQAKFNLNSKLEVSLFQSAAMVPIGRHNFARQQMQSGNANVLLRSRPTWTLGEA